MSLEVVIAIIVISLILQAFFAGSEIALISCDKVKMRSLAEEGSKSAKLVLTAFGQIEQFISTTLVGINLSLTVAFTGYGCLKLETVQKNIRQFYFSIIIF